MTQRLIYADFYPPRNSKESDTEYMARARRWQQAAGLLVHTFDGGPRPVQWSWNEQDYRAWDAWQVTLPHPTDPHFLHHPQSWRAELGLDEGAFHTRHCPPTRRAHCTCQRDSIRAGEWRG